MWTPSRFWRVTQAEPTGCQMWFDPDTEEPGIRDISPPDGDEVDPFYEGGALGPWPERDGDGTSGKEEGVPCEGDAAKTSEEDQRELPF